MYTKQALRELGLDGGELSDQQKHQLDDLGYIIVENYYSRAEAKDGRRIRPAARSGRRAGRS
jgi:hypothetical protein